MTRCPADAYSSSCFLPPHTDLDFQPVFVTLVAREYTAPLMSNEFVPLAETVPVWIRPYTTIATLDALDTDDCPVRYQLQSGKTPCLLVAWLLRYRSLLLLMTEQKVSHVIEIAPLTPP